ncbi:MAG TPA: PQQ-binding-like beta-propeller repeat protein [Pirellulaceae bacterium]|nr:PQQ-binding-like beta-propeller repeat protein [Pirellulaceae bacterium]
MICLGCLSATAEDWPRWRGPRGDGTWNEPGIVEKFPSATIARKWTAEIGAGYTSPTVAEGRVYLMDRLTKPTSTERILCFDEETGRELWKVAYECEYGKIGYQAGPRAAVTIDGGKAYALGATGRMHCLNAATGEIVWQRDLERDYDIQMPIWGLAGSPLIVQDLVVLHIGGRGGACIVALDKNSGKEAWKALDDRGQYTTPVLVEQAKTPVLICWTGDSVAGLEASTGRVLWRHPWKPRNMPIGIATPVVEKDRVFFTSFYDGSLMLRLAADKPEAEVLWKLVGTSERITDALHSIISTPVFDGGHIYGVDSYGELRCLDADNGERLWEDLTATPQSRWSTIHFVKNGERYWLFNERGELIIGKLSPRGFEEISRSKLLDPTTEQLRQRGGVCWSHPAFANQCVFARNDKELVCASLAEP